MKILSRDDATRPQDAADLAALRKRCTPQDLQAVRGLLQLISERGFARGKDLLAELDRLPS